MPLTISSDVHTSAQKPKQTLLKLWRGKGFDHTCNNTLDHNCGLRYSVAITADTLAVKDNCLRIPVTIEPLVIVDALVTVSLV